MHNKLISYLKLIAAVSFWGASFVATKIALLELPPLSIILLRMILAVSLLTLIALFTKKDFTITRKNHTGVLILALIASFHLWIQVTGLQYTSAANTGWIIGLTPVFMALISFFVFKELLNAVKIIGILIAFTGLLLLISRGDLTNVDLISNKGDFLVLGSSVTWSIYSLVNKKVSLSYDPTLTILFLFLMMAVIISPFTLNGKFFTDITKLSVSGWGAIFFLGIFCSGFAYVFWAQALKEMHSSSVGAFLYFEPFVTVFTAWIFLKEEITLFMMISGVIITFGIVLVNVEKKTLMRMLRNR